MSGSCLRINEIPGRNDLFGRGLRVCGLVHIFLLLLAPVPVFGQPDSLTLQAPMGVVAIPQMNPNRERFTNWIFWQDIPDVDGTFIHPPDTSGWRGPMSTVAQSALSVPSSSGVHSGTIDRTITFISEGNGTVGVTPNTLIRYVIVKEERFEGRINVGPPYIVGDPIPVIFTDENALPQPDTLDLGLMVHFGPGLIDSNGVFRVGLEDFEGYHVWRGTERDGSNLVVIAELSKQEGFDGEADSVYFEDAIPALRATGVYRLQDAIQGFPTVLDIRNVHPNGVLGPNELAWFDRNAFNGFTYQYAVTSFDRDYSVISTQQGLNKIEHCLPQPPMPYDCQNEIVTVVSNVTPQNDLQKVYAVPNPYRSGSSQFTTQNYHNFPDNRIRFVNLPTNCLLKIFTPAGDIVWETTNNTGSGNVSWNTRNNSGELVSSGIYMYRVEKTSGADVFGRLIIIR